MSAAVVVGAGAGVVVVVTGAAVAVVVVIGASLAVVAVVAAKAAIVVVVVVAVVAAVVVVTASLAAIVGKTASAVSGKTHAPNIVPRNRNESPVAAPTVNVHDDEAEEFEGGAQSLILAPKRACCWLGASSMCTVICPLLTARSSLCGCCSLSDNPPTESAGRRNLTVAVTPADKLSLDPRAV